MYKRVELIRVCETIITRELRPRPAEFIRSVGRKVLFTDGPVCGLRLDNGNGYGTLLN